MENVMLASKWEARLNSVGTAVLRYSLVFFFVAFGLYKFTPREAADVQPLMAHSLLLFWVDPAFGVRGGSVLIGIIEIAIGLAIAGRRFAPTLSAWGSLGAAFALLNTLSFLFTTPGLDPQSSDAGFLLKDLTLLGAALWTAAEASAAARSGNAGFAGRPGLSKPAGGR
jgi:uncharacterized membrane protein YkgB